MQSYPVNLALNVSSITLLLISNRIILDNENCSEFRQASSQKTLTLLTESKMAAGVGNSFKSRDVGLASGCLSYGVILGSIFVCGPLHHYVLIFSPRQEPKAMHNHEKFYNFAVTFSKDSL